VIEFVLALMTIVEAAPPTPPDPPDAPIELFAFVQGASPNDRWYFYIWQPDPWAYTHIYANGSWIATLNPGVTSWLSYYRPYGGQITFTAKHERDGVLSAASPNLVLTAIT
jgi:hypothetical protein